MTRMTKTAQQSMVGQGLAVGVLALGATATTSAKMAVESAFIDAWREWTWSSSFPTIHASHARNDFLTIVHKSSRRRDAFVAAWDCGRTLEPYLLNGDSVEEAAELLESFGGPPAHSWTELARFFLDTLGDGKVIYQPHS